MLSQFIATQAGWSDPLFKLFPRDVNSLPGGQQNHRHTLDFPEVRVTPRAAPHLVHREPEGLVAVRRLDHDAVLNAATIAPRYPAGFHIGIVSSYSPFVRRSRLPYRALRLATVKCLTGNLCADKFTLIYTKAQQA